MLGDSPTNRARDERLWRHCGLWLSLVERCVRDAEAVGSNPTSPIVHLSRSVAFPKISRVLTLIFQSMRKIDPESRS
jgi:hypothetical protein